MKGIRRNRCSEIIQELKRYQINSNCYSLVDWRHIRQTSRNGDIEQIIVEDYQQRTINYNVNVERGNVLIDNNIGANANITNEYMTEEVLESRIEVLPDNN